MTTRTKVLIGILVVLVSAGGILAWQHWWMPRYKVPPVIPSQEKQVTINTDKTECEQGKIMTVTVANRTEASIFYFSSSFMLYKYKDGEWVASPYPWRRGLEVPQMEVELLYEGFEEVKSLLTEIKANTDKKFIDSVDTKWINLGKYRLGFRYALDSDEKEWKIIYSNEFTIKEKTTIQKDPRCLMPKPTEIGGCKILRGFYYDASSNECKAIGGCEVVGEIPFSGVQKQECIQLCVEK